MTVARKLLLPTLALFAVALVALVWYFANNTLASAQAEQTRELERLMSGLTARLTYMEDLAISMAAQTAQSQEVQFALAADDRQLLAQITLPTYQRLNELYDIPVFQFHLPPATLYLRPNQPSLGGEDQSATRLNVLAANTHRRNASGVELFPEGLLVTGIAPIKSSSGATGYASPGQHLGTVEYGLRADKTLLAKLKTEYGADWHILLKASAIEAAGFQPASSTRPGPLPEMLLLVTTMTEPAFASPEAYQVALSGETATSQISAGDKQLALLSVPLRDFTGDTLGVVDIIIDRTAAANELRDRLITSIGVGLVGLLLGGATLIVITQSILRPVQDLTNATVAIAQGDLTRSLPLARRRIPDEITQLSQNFAMMTGQLRATLTGLEQRVAERTRALEASAEVSRRLSTVLDAEQLAEAVVNEVQHSFDYYHAHIYLYDENNENLVMVGGTGEAGRTMLQQGHKIPKGRGLVGRAADSNQVVLVPDTAQDPGWLPNPLLPETKAEVAVPIVVGERVLGVLDVQHDVIQGLTEQDAQLLQSIANQVGIAVQNARLFEMAQRQAERETLANVIAQRIQASTTVEGMLQVALRELAQALDTQQASIQLGITVPGEDGR